ncbi:conserved hypothetical protein [Sphingomonas sp. EC-HK361]|uniref:hypothetical protein n=1 Tax=Sphingomonas sp. EC-HK361 TaxID=2038397 RepID=UPI001252DAC8|nr:hypothetical protein [Sphingomonas sp. EC-HK361]VVS97486.1 conserved hypothetical protein [Sphingomonas sp. EC-HK361]
MDSRRRTTVIAGFALALALVSARHPTADLRFINHEAWDSAPHRFQAAVDLGLMGVSVLVTWTSSRLAPRS